MNIQENASLVIDDAENFNREFSVAEQSPLTAEDCEQQHDGRRDDGNHTDTTDEYPGNDQQEIHNEDNQEENETLTQNDEEEDVSEIQNEPEIPNKEEEDFSQIQNESDTPDEEEEEEGHNEEEEDTMEQDSHHGKSAGSSSVMVHEGGWFITDGIWSMNPSTQEPSYSEDPQEEEIAEDDDDSDWQEHEEDTHSFEQDTEQHISPQERIRALDDEHTDGVRRSLFQEEPSSCEDGHGKHDTELEDGHESNDTGLAVPVMVAGAACVAFPFITAVLGAAALTEFTAANPLSSASAACGLAVAGTTCALWRHGLKHGTPAGEQADDADDADAGTCTPNNEPNDDGEEEEPDEEREPDTDDDDDDVFDAEVDEAALRSEVQWLANDGKGESKGRIQTRQRGEMWSHHFLASVADRVEDLERKIGVTFSCGRLAGGGSDGRNEEEAAAAAEEAEAQHLALDADADESDYSPDSDLEQIYYERDEESESEPDADADEDEVDSAAKWMRNEERWHRRSERVMPVYGRNKDMTNKKEIKAWGEELMREELYPFTTSM